MVLGMLDQIIIVCKEAFLDKFMLSALFLSIAISKTAAVPVTLKQAVVQVLSQNPAVYSVVQEYKSRAFEVREAQAGYLPDIDLTLGLGYHHVDTPSKENDKIRRESGIRLSQMLFDGFSARNEVRRQKSRQLSAKYEAFAVAENQSLRAVEVYLTVMKNKELLALAEESLKTHKKIQKQMRNRKDAGVGSEADLSQVQARVALAGGNVVTAQSNYDDAVSNYLRVVGSYPIVDKMQRPQSVSNQFSPDIKEETEKALYEHPTLIAATNDVTAAQAQHSASKSQHWPRVHLEAHKSIEQDVGGVEGRDEDFVVAIRLRYDLYVGGANKSRRDYTGYQVEEAKGIRDNAHLQVIEAMRLSYNAYYSLKKVIQYQQQHVDFALQTRDAYKEQYNLGKRSLLDVLNTENEYINAKRSLTQSGFDQLFAEFRIMNAKGKLVDSLKIDIQRLLAEN